MHSQEAIITFNRFIKLIFIGSEQVRLRERETMLHSFKREGENLKFDIIFQAKLFTLCLCFCVSVFVFWANGLPSSFRTKKKNH